jgi:hypothetical protein
MSRPPGRGARSLGRRALFALGVSVLLASACLSPTLPLPPPNRPDTIEGPDQDGNVRLTGAVLPHGIANALNRETGRGVSQRTLEDGRYELLLGAQVGDEILFWYSLQGENSQAIRFEVPGTP